MSRRHASFVAMALLAGPLLIVAASPPPAAGESWPQFRGPTGQGLSTAGRLPVEWSERQGVAWKTAVPGRGWSSPVFEDDLIWFTTAITEEADEAEKARIVATTLAKSPIVKQMEIVSRVYLRAVAVRGSDGKIVHDVKVLTVDHPDPLHELNTYASPTPAIAEGRLLCHFGNLGTVCLDAKTLQPLWTKRFAHDHSVGPGSSPIIYDQLAIIPCDGTDVQFVVALNMATGEEVWRAKRPPLAGEPGDTHKAFSTPLKVAAPAGDQIVIPCAQWIVAYEPKTGATIWQVRHGAGFSVAPTAVAAHGMVYFSTGFTAPELWAVRCDGRGDVTQSHVAWTAKQQIPAISSPLVVDDAVYVVSDQGVATSFNAQSGAVNWRNRVGGNFSASPLAADGKIYFCNREGETTVLAAGGAWQKLATNAIDGQISASPAVYYQSLLLRSETHLYRIGK